MRIVPPSSPPLGRDVRLFVFFVLALTGLRAHYGPPKPLPMKPIPAEAAATPALWAADTSAETSRVLSSGQDVPGAPLDGQERHRCWEGVAVLINGGCWVLLGQRPPCAPGTFQHAGACYIPQTKRPDVPVSLLP